MLDIYLILQLLNSEGFYVLFDFIQTGFNYPDNYHSIQSNKSNIIDMALKFMTNRTETFANIIICSHDIMI